VIYIHDGFTLHNPGARSCEDCGKGHPKVFPTISHDDIGTFCKFHSLKIGYFGTVEETMKLWNRAEWFSSHAVTLEQVGEQIKAAISEVRK
jgi:hypothetical protein